MEIIIPNKCRSSIEVIRPFDLFVCVYFINACEQINIRRDESKARKELDSMRARGYEVCKIEPGFILRHELDKKELEKATYIKFERRSRICWIRSRDVNIAYDCLQWLINRRRNSSADIC